MTYHDPSPFVSDHGVPFRPPRLRLQNTPSLSLCLHTLHHPFPFAQAPPQNYSAYWALSLSLKVFESIFERVFKWESRLPNLVTAFQLLSCELTTNLRHGLSLQSLPYCYGGRCLSCRCSVPAAVSYRRRCLHYLHYLDCGPRPLIQIEFLSREASWGRRNVIRVKDCGLLERQGGVVLVLCVKRGRVSAIGGRVAHSHLRKGCGYTAIWKQR